MAIFNRKTNSYMADTALITLEDLPDNKKKEFTKILEKYGIKFKTGQQGMVYFEGNLVYSHGNDRECTFIKFDEYSGFAIHITDTDWDLETMNINIARMQKIKELMLEISKIDKKLVHLR